MEFKKLNKKIINSWRVARLIRLIIFLSIALFDTFIWDMDGTVWTIVFYGLWAITAYCLISFIVYPPLEYRQWGYYIDDEKVANILLEDFRSGKIGNMSLEKVNFA